MKILPELIVPNSNVAFNDTESSTAMQTTYKLYGAMNDLIKEYNAFVSSMNKAFDGLKNQVKTDHEEFETSIRQEFQDFIDTIDLKISALEKEIEDASKYMNDNIIETSSKLFNDAIKNGDIKATLKEEYNAETEELILSVNVEGGIE